MNTLVETLNGWGNAWLVLSVERAVASGVVFGAVLALALMGRRFVSAHFLSWTWLLPLIPLVVPIDRWVPTFESPVAPVEALRDMVTPPKAGSESRNPWSAPSAKHSLTMFPASGGPILMTETCASTCFLS